MNLVDVGRYSRISQGVASTPAGGYPTPVAAAGAVEGLLLQSSRGIFGSAKPAVEPVAPSKALTLQGYIRFHDKLEAEDQLLKAPNDFTFF